MKKIFLYYSLTGNGDLVAEFFKKKGYDIQKIKIKKDLPKNTFLKILIGGYRSLINYQEELIDFKNVDNYSQIVIGSPVWNSRLSTPITTVLKSINNDNIDFILYSGSGTANKAEEFIKKNYPKAKVTILKEPKKNIKELKKI